MQLFYTPQHARVGDVIPYYEDGKFHLFYLKNWNPYFGSDRKDGWHLLNTKDMVHYGDGDWDSGRNGICHQGRWDLPFILLCL